MSASPEPTHRDRPRLASMGLVVAMAMAIMAVVTIPGVRADAVTTPKSTLTSDWLASKVAAEGSVTVPGEPFGVTNQTMFVALGLAASGEHRDALARAMTWIGTHVDDWVVDSDGSGSSVGPVGADLPGRLGQLLMLVHATGGDPRAFGSPSTNLVARLEALLGDGGTPGFYGWPDPTSAVQDQSYAVLGLVAVSATVPSAALQWLVDQQCPQGGASGTAGGWTPLRAVTGGVLDSCTTPDPLMYSGPETNSTALAIQALAAADRKAPIAAGLAFLKGAQEPTGGFPWYPTGDPDPNSTALVIQAIVAAGQAPTGAAWTVGGNSPLTALLAWQLPAPDAGAFEFPYPGMFGVPNLYATFQALWGLTQTAFPFPTLAPWPPSTTTSTELDPASVPNFTG